MAYTPVATDNFNRADGALGANWTVAYNGGYTIAGNAARSNGSNNDACSYYSGASFANDQYAKATVLAAPLTHYYALGVAIRAAGSAGSGRNYAYIGLRDNSEKYVARVNNGTPTALRYTNSAGIALNDIMQLDAESTLLSPFLNGSADPHMAPITDATYSNGSPGLHCYNGNAAAQMDDWEGGDITAGGALSGTSSGSATAIGNLAGAGAVSGTSSSTTTASGVLAGAGALSGTASGLGAAVGVLAGSGAVSGTSSSTTTASGTLAGAGALSGTSSGEGAASGVIAGAGALSGTASAVGDASGTLTNVPAGAGALSGSASATTSASGTLAGAGSLSGTGSAAGTASGNLAGVGALAGTSSATSAASASVSGLVFLTGTASATSSASGTIAGAGSLSGSAQALTAASAILAGAGALSGLASALGSASSHLSDLNNPALLISQILFNPVATSFAIFNSSSPHTAKVNSK